jgi:hypothetical protein
MNQNDKEVLLWFAARGTKNISQKDVMIWRPELLESFDQMVENKILEYKEGLYSLTLDARNLINQMKAGDI